MSTSKRVARVVLDTRLPQLDRLFDYYIPEGLDVAPGMRVKVPLRSQQRLAEGFVVSVESESEHAGKLVNIHEVVSPVEVLPGHLWRLAEALARRGAGSVSDVLRLAIPKRYVRVEKAWWESSGGRPATASTDARRELTSPLLHSGSRTWLAAEYGMTATLDGVPVPERAVQLSKVVAQALEVGMCSVVVVPDWRDVESFQRALSDVVPPESLLVLGAETPGARRYENYLRCLSGGPVVVLGSRHAIYAPVPDGSLLVVVDDADGAHREPLAPYPHTRDVAVMRAQQSNSPLIFSSLQPSLAVRRWLDKGFLHAAGSPTLSRPRVIPTALSTTADYQSPARLPSQVYTAAQRAVTRGPVLFQVFRSGHSPGLSCANCKARATCGQCGGPLRRTRAGEIPICAWCGVVSAHWACGQCHNTTLAPRGQAIGRTVSDLGRSFPSVPIVQSDGENLVATIPSRPQIVVATRGAEPLVEGGYQLVVLLDAASMLNRESISALEESIVAWENAVAKAADTAEVYVTDLDGAPALAMAAGNWDQLLRHELQQREQLRLPPAVRVASLTGPSESVEQVVKSLQEKIPALDTVGPHRLASGAVTQLLRFPYLEGDAVTEELRAWRVKLATAHGSPGRERLTVVVDDALAFDALTER